MSYANYQLVYPERAGALVTLVAGETVHELDLADAQALEELAAAGSFCESCGLPGIHGVAFLHNDCPAARPQPSPLRARRAQWDRMRSRVAPRILERDGHQCLRCGSTEDLTVDHVIPISKGGGDEDGNLQTLCGRCNSSKGDR